ncbi:MAG: M42 family metallopeptidase [Armatimonadota bacterium]|jgi:endoglucanase
MRDATVELLRELTEANGVPGFEGNIAKIVEREVGAFTDISRDHLGSIICEKDGGSGGPKIMLAGHMDEIGFMVNIVTKKGFVKFSPLGGWWDQVLLGQRVVIETRKGPVTGIIGSKPPHLLSPDERNKVQKRSNMFIDVGARDKRQATDTFGILPGDPITPLSAFGRMANKQLLMAKAWDDRVGVGLFVETLKRLKRRKHPNVLFGVGTVQEEVGLRGAQTSVQTIGPDLGIVLETGIAGDVPGISDEESSVKLGGGVTIYLLEGSMIPDARFRDFAIDVCKRDKIPHQVSILERGGTDGGRMHLHARGVPCLIVGVPTRHIHSHTGIIHARDFDNAVKLLLALIKRLDAARVAKLLSPP